jgi:maltose alpha-D-glucosyltransferase/alpha-amylase
LEPSLLKAEQSNSSVVYKDRFILKLFRRLESGMNPDLEIGRFLTEMGFPHIPPVAGALEYRQGRSAPMTLAILQGLVQNQGDAWQYTLDFLSDYLEHALARRGELRDMTVPQKHLLDLSEGDFHPLASEMIGAYTESARLLGQRTAELHTALASAPDDLDFAPEPFSKLYQRSLYQSMRSLTTQVLDLLRKRLKTLPKAVQPEAQQILDRKDDVLNCSRSVLEQKITAMRIRCHGDYHLGQVLCTGKDFVIIDFEGEPAHSLSERRIKRSPLRDAAGMLRSFHYASYAALFSQQSTGLAHPEDLPHLERWLGSWCVTVSVTFLKAYLKSMSQGNILPQAPRELQILLDAYLLEKVVYELGYELNNRPDWARIPIRGILGLLGHGA